MGEVYVIKKSFTREGKKVHVLVTTGSEVMEIRHLNIAEKFCEVMNENSDSGCHYTIVGYKPVKE